MSSILLNFTSCTEQQQTFVKDIQLRTHQVEEEAFVEVGTILDLGNVSLPSFETKIPHPKDFNDSVGKLFFAPTLDGRNEIRVDLNLSKVAKLPGGIPTLPNGGSLPIGGIDRIDVIEIPVPKVHGTIYFALDKIRAVAMIGFALNIPKADGIGTAIGEGQLFPHFTIGKVKMFAGVYTSPDPGNTGIGIFSDLSSVITPKLIDLAVSQDKISAEDFNVAINSKKFNKTRFFKGRAPLDLDYMFKLKRFEKILKSDEKIFVKF